MDKLSIETLVPNSNTAITQNSSTLDVNSLVNIKKSYDDVYKTLTADTIIKTRNEKREKLLNIYLKYYLRCIEKIKVLNASNKTDLVYDVPDICTDCAEYNSYDCIEFIERKLANEYMDTFIINARTVFITWKFIELNKLQKNKSSQ